MLEKVKEYALEKFAGDEGLAEEFVKGFTKEAMASPAQRAATAGGGGGGRLPATIEGSMREGLGKQLGSGLAGLLLSGGVGATAYAMNQVKRSNLHSQFLQSLEQALASNRILREANRDKVKQYAETIFKFAPNVAADVNLLNSILANAVHGEGIDPMTIKTLTELENRFTTNTGVIGSIKSFI
jgi:hypothetical protein